MWNTKASNIICNYLNNYMNQKKHIERVLSAKEIINNKIKPLYPKFLKFKICKLQMEEEKNNRIKEENKLMFHKIIDAETKPSKYSRIYEPKICPSFNKEIICYSRVKKAIKNYQENINFYGKLEKVKSFYQNKKLVKRNRNIDNNIRRLQKSILEIQPSLLFISPEKIKNEIMKYRNIITENRKKVKRNCFNNYQKYKTNYNQNRLTIDDKNTGEKSDKIEKEKNVSLSLDKNKSHPNRDKNNLNKKRLKRNISELNIFQ